MKGKTWSSSQAANSMHRHRSAGDNQFSLISRVSLITFPTVFFSLKKKIKKILYLIFFPCLKAFSMKKVLESESLIVLRSLFGDTPY